MTSTNDGKDLKSIPTRAPKGKSYYIELYKSLEARLSEGGEPGERARHLCAAWRGVHSICRHAAPSTHAHLLSWLQRHTARALLQAEWRKPERKDDRQSLEEAIDGFIAQVSDAQINGVSHSWETQLVARGEWFKRVIDNPWDHPVLTLLLNPNGTPPTDDEVLAWLKEERGVTFVVRLHTLVGEKCDDIAVSLATAVMERVRASLPATADSEEPSGVVAGEGEAPIFANRLKEEAGFTPDVFEMLVDIEFVLLHKRDSKRDTKTCIALAKQTPLLDAYPLIERLQKRLEVAPREKRLWKNAKAVAILIAQVVIARCMVVKQCVGAARTALYCCARILARLLTAALPGAADALAAQAPTARHLHTLAQAVDKQFTPAKEETKPSVMQLQEEMRPYVCELYVRAITAGMNELERLKLKTEKEAEARSMEKTLASWFVQLGTVLARSARISCECALTAFSLHPSRAMYERIDAAPPLAPLHADGNESNEETVKSEFGSWANDSRSQTNLVKTSETLNMKHTQRQSNVLSTAIFNEGEGLGLSLELCQDIAVLLSGPRVKTLSWDMDRTLLLENCRAYSEMTHGGTRVLTRELKYLNLDPQQYQHLPEEKDDDENDPYYGIERGYEHLAVLEEPQEIWEDSNDLDKTESASSIESDYPVPRRKKKAKVHTSDEDSDPLSYVAEAKRILKKKERPHSKERSKERKKKQELVDPLDITTPNQNETETKPIKDVKPKEKKERKKRVPKVIGGKRSSLASVLGIKIPKAKKKPKEISTVTTPVANTNITGNKYVQPNIPERPQTNLTRMQYRPTAPNAVRPQTMADYNKLMMNNFKIYPDDVRANLSKLLEYRRQNELNMAEKNNAIKAPPRAAAIIRRDIPLQANITPKGVAIPEIPKSYINKEQMERMSENVRLQNNPTAYDSVIQYATTNFDVNKPGTSSDKTSVKRPKAKKTISQNRGQDAKSNSFAMADIINPSYDRLMAEIAERHRHQELLKPNSQPLPAHSQYPMAQTPRPIQSLNKLTPQQRDFQNFVRNYENNKYSILDMSKPQREVKKPVMPVNRVIPIVPNIPKPEHNHVQFPKQEPNQVQFPKQEPNHIQFPKQEPNQVQFPKQELNPVQFPKQEPNQGQVRKAEPKQMQFPIPEPKQFGLTISKPPMQKKPEATLNTFSRLSYHKNKQNEMKNRIQNPTPACTTTTYQEVSSELDQIIKEHQRAQMKVIQAKRENVDRVKPAHTQEPSATKGSKEHPLLCNLLQSSPSVANIPYQNETFFKSNPAQQIFSATPKTSLSEKDNNDLLNLLRQKNILIGSNYQYSSTSKAPMVTGHNLTTTPTTTSVCKTATISNHTSTTVQSPIGSKTSPVSHHNLTQAQQQPNKVNMTPKQVSQQPKKPNVTSHVSQQLKTAKTFAATLETKLMNVLSKTLLNPGYHEINSSISVKCNPQSSCSTPTTKHTNSAKNSAKRNVFNKNQAVKKYIPESSKPEWQAVMSDLLRHKTPTRGPNALDVALNKSSFELAFEKSLKEGQRLAQSKSVPKDTASKSHEKSDKAQPVSHEKSAQPVSTAIQNEVIIKKGTKHKKETMKQASQSSTSTDIKAFSKEPLLDTNEKPKKPNTGQTPAKKLSQEVQRKQFTYTGPKLTDPFISGIPNSDYDLLDELIDDDLRKEIGEISSDDESYNSAAQSFLKSPKSNERRVSVQFNKCLNEPAVKVKTEPRYANDHQPTNDGIQSIAPKSMHDVVKKEPQVVQASTLPKEHQTPSTQAQNDKRLTAPTSKTTTQSSPTQISKYTTSQNEPHHSEIFSSSQLKVEPNVYITTVPPPAPLQNVVLVGQEVIYGRYNSVETPGPIMNSLPNAYLAVKNAPTMTLYQATEYTAPVVVGTSVTVPVINNVPYTGITVQSNVGQNLPEISYPTVNVAHTSAAEIQAAMTTYDEHSNTSNLDREAGIGPQTSTLETKVAKKTEDTHTKIKHPDQETGNTQVSHKVQEENKISERKVLSEVQDFVASDNIDKMRNQKTESRINIKKETVDSERLMKKRLAIINREIYHRCGEKIIPLTYYPLPTKIGSVLEKHKSLISADETQKLTDREEEQLLMQLKSNLQDLSDAINEVSSPATPDSNDSKENCTVAPCRRILLRSSNKIMPKPNVEKLASELPSKITKKTKTKQKSVVHANEDTVTTNNVKTSIKETGTQKRASKRIRNKKSTVNTEEDNKPLEPDLHIQGQKPKTKLKSTKKRGVKTEPLKTAVAESLEHLDFESELKITKISKIVPGNKQNLDDACNKSLPCRVDTALAAEKSAVKSHLQLTASKTTGGQHQTPQSSAVSANIHQDTVIQDDVINGTSKQSMQKEAISGEAENKDKVFEVPIIYDTSLEHMQMNVTPSLIEIEIAIPVNSQQNTSLFGKASQNPAAYIDVPIENIITEDCIPPNHNVIKRNEQPEETKGDKLILDKNEDVQLHHDKATEQIKDKVTEQYKDKVTEQYKDKVTEQYKDKVTEQNKDKDTEQNKDKITEQNNKNGTEEPNVNVNAAIEKGTSEDMEKSGKCSEETINKVIDNESSKPNMHPHGEMEKISTSPEKSPEILEISSTYKDFTEPAKNCETLDNNTTNDQNKNDVIDPDLDMTVTCEEVPKVCSTFGNVKTARRKPINSDSVKEAKVYQHFAVNNKGIGDNENTKEKEVLVADSQASKMSEKVKQIAEIESTTPTTPSSTNPGVGVDDDDDVLIVGDEPVSTRAIQQDDDCSAKKHVFGVPEVNENKLPSGEYAYDVPILNKINIAVVKSDKNIRDDKSLKAVQTEHKKATCSKTFSESENKQQTDLNRKSNVNDSKELSNIEHLKNNIQIKRLQSDDPMKSRVRITLPNGKKIIATVGGKAFITLDDLFTYPSIKAILLNEMNCSKRFVMYVEQTAILDRSNKVLSAEINKLQTPILINQPVATPVQTNPVATIDLLSDEEDNDSSPQIKVTDKQEFVTECGKFAVSPMDKDLFTKHQIKFNLKPKILLKRVDENSDSQWINSQFGKIRTEMRCADTVSNFLDKKMPLFSNENVSKLLNDKNDKFVPEVDEQINDMDCKSSLLQNLVKNVEESIHNPSQVNTAKTFSEVVEIDDSSSDSLYQFKSGEAIKEDKTINNLKNVLLKELGVDICTQDPVNKPDSDEAAPVEEIKFPRHNDRKKLLKLKDIPNGISCPFIDLNQDDQLHITKRKCAINLVRCDELVMKYEDDNNKSSDLSVLDNHKVILEPFNLLTDFDDKIEETEERSSSPVIELTDMLLFLDDNKSHTSLGNGNRSLLCKANWHNTKSILRSQNTESMAITAPVVFESDTNNHLTDQTLSICCEANWFTTKFAFHLESFIDETLRSQVSQNDNMLVYDANVTGETILPSNISNGSPMISSIQVQNVDGIALQSTCHEEMHVEDLNENTESLTCEAIWLIPKPALHLEGLKKAAVALPIVLEYDVEMIGDNISDKTIPLSCEANWLMTKSTIHLQATEDEILKQFIVSENDNKNTNAHESVPLTCDASWIATKTLLRSQSIIKDETQLYNIVEDNKIDDSRDTDVLSLSCEAQWFTTKATLHLEVESNPGLVQSNISSVDNKQCDGSSTSSAVNIGNLKPQQHKQAPTLVSLVLECFQDTKIFQQYSLLHKSCIYLPINFLKRKPPSLQSAVVRKLRKLNKKTEINTLHCSDLQSNVVVPLPTSDFKNVSEDIVSNIKVVCLEDYIPVDPNRKHDVKTTECDDKNYTHTCTDEEEQLVDPTWENCKRLKTKIIESNLNIEHVNENNEILPTNAMKNEKSSESHVDKSVEFRSAHVTHTEDLTKNDDDTTLKTDAFSIHDSESLPLKIIINELPQTFTGNKMDTTANQPGINNDSIMNDPPSPSVIDQLSLECFESKVSPRDNQPTIANDQPNTSEQIEDAIDLDVSNTIYLLQEKQKLVNSPITDVLVSTGEIKSHSIQNSNSSHCDEIEVRLAEIVGESLKDVLNDDLNNRHNFKMSNSEKSEIITILVEETTANTDSHVSNNEGIASCEDDSHPGLDHQYYSSLDGTVEINTSSKVSNEVFVPTDSVTLLSDSEGFAELEEEIVEMYSDEVVDALSIGTTTESNVCDNSKNQEQNNGLVKNNKSKIAASEGNNTSEQTIKNHLEDLASCQAQKSKSEVNLDVIETCVVAIQNDGDVEENTSELLTDVSAENIMSKYLALIRNKSQVLESVVEYEDPEAGTCYVIPIIEESSRITTETDESIENASLIVDDPNTKKDATTSAIVLDSSLENLASPSNEPDDSSYDDIEAKLAEIVGENLPDTNEKNRKEIRLDEKYKTSYSVEVEAISSPENLVDMEEETCQLTGNDKQNSQKSLMHSSGAKRICVTNIKLCSKTSSISDNIGNECKTNIFKISNDGQTKTRRKSVKRKIEMSASKPSEKKFTLDNKVVTKSITKLKTNTKIKLSRTPKTKNVVFRNKHKDEAILSSRNDDGIVCSSNQGENKVCREAFQESLEASNSSCSKNNDIENTTDICDNESLIVKLPKHTYLKAAEEITTHQRTLKRKIDMSDTKTSERKYRKGKNIDYPKFTAAALSETVYAKEYKNLIDYCSSVKFSYALSFHKENIEVHEILKSWPIQNTHAQTTTPSEESNESLFSETEKSEALSDPLVQTLPEEIISKFDENSYTHSNIQETNFNMGFGERSGRVIQESKDGEFTTFSAATLSDVKQLQPLLPSDEKMHCEKVTPVRTNDVDNKIRDQKMKAKRFVDHLNLRQRVRMFFEKTKYELASDWELNQKKDDFETIEDWPFGDLTSTRCIIPAPVQVMVNVVQVGQLPVSAAAQNPVTCDPRVTHVSNASPSQCSPGNSLGDELQTPIKTEYTELTTANITLPLMQEYVQHHSMPSDSQEPTNLYTANDSTSLSTQIKSVVKIELMEETSQDNEDTVEYENNSQQLQNGTLNNVQYQFENVNNVSTEIDSNATAINSSKTPSTVTLDNQVNVTVEKPDQLAHAMNAAGISAIKGPTRPNNPVDTIQQSIPPTVVAASQANATNFSKTSSINAIALQQALAQILPPPLNQTTATDNNPQASTTPQVLHIVQGNNAQSVINKPNGTQLLHIVQNKSATNTNGTPTPQQNTFSGLSLVDGTLQQGGNQLLHIVNTANQKNTNAGQLLKRVNLLTNLANVQGSNEQKMVQFVCKSADGKSIQLPHQRSMVLRLQPLDPSNVPTPPKQNDNQDHSSTSGTTHTINEKESSPQEMKSRSLYEENYAKFVQNDPKFAPNGDTKPAQEKATSLPKFNQVFGKQVYQEKQNEVESETLPENSNPSEDNAPLEQINDLTNSPMLIRKTNPAQGAHVQPNLVQQIKQSIGPMNIQTMHGGVIYTRQIPVNIGNGQTINLITVPSTELVDDSGQKQQADAKFGNQEADPPIIKLVSTNQPGTAPNVASDDNNGQLRSTNENNPQPTPPQPQPVLTQMRIKLPMLSKAPQMVGGTRVVRPSFFQIQRNVIGGANQQVYQQLVLTAAPPLGPSIRLPAQVQKPKTPSETQSSPESQMSSSTLEQLREFDMVLEQVKERSTVQPGSSSSTNNFTKLKSSPDTTDAPTPSTSNQDSPTQVLYSVGNTQPLNMVNYVNRKSTITSTTTSSFVRSPDSTGTVESPSSSTHSHLPHTVTSDSCASSSCASEAAATTPVQPKPKKKKPKPSTSNSNPFNIKNTPKPSSQKPLEDEQTTQRILYILAEYKEQVENSPDKDKPAPRRRNNPAAPNAGSSKRKKSGSRRRDSSPVTGEDGCPTMGSEDSSCGTSLGECNDCLETHSPEESPKKVARRLTFEQEVQVTQARTPTTTTTTTVPQRNVIVTDGQAFAVRGATGKPATTVLMPANYLLPVSMVKGGQQIAIVTNRGPKLIVGAGEGGSGGTLLFQRLIGPGGLKPILARPGGVRHIRLPTAALHNLQAFNIATPIATSVQPPDSTASPAPAPAPPDLVDTRAMSSPWPDRDAGEAKPEGGNSSPEGSEPWNLPSSSIADDYGYEEIVRTDNMDRTVLDAIPDRYSPDLEAQRIFDKMFDSDSKKSMYDSRCGYDIDASDDDKAYPQVVHRKDGRHTTRLTHVSAAALRHKYAILEHELRLQKSLSEECEDLGVDSPSASELFPEAELLFAPSPAHEQTIDHCHTPQPTIHTQGVPQPDLDDQIATDHLLSHKDHHDDLDINLDDVGEIVTVGEDGMTTIPLDHEEFARSHEEFARSHPNTTFHSEPEDGEVPPFTIAQSVKGRQITFHSRSVPGTVVMAPQTTVISQATVEATGTQNPVKFSDLDNMINVMPTTQHMNMPSVLKESNENLTKFDRLLNESRDLNLSNAPSAIVHSTGNGTQVIRRVQYERRDSRYLVEDDAMIAGDSKTDERRDLLDDTSSSERHPELFWDTQSRPERKRFDFSSDSDKCCKSPYDETNSDSSGIGAHTRLDTVIKAARPERRRSDGSSAEESHPPLRTYPPKRTHQHHSHHHDVDRSLTGKTRASDRCHDVKDESRRRASNRGVVKRGCHCCNGSTPPKPKKSRPKKSGDYPHN